MREVVDTPPPSNPQPRNSLCNSSASDLSGKRSQSSRLASNRLYSLTPYALCYSFIVDSDAPLSSHSSYPIGGDGASLRTSDEIDGRLVGTFVRVFWEEEDMWYRGRVVKYEADTKNFRVHYDDGTKRSHQLGDPEVMWERESLVPDAYERPHNELMIVRQSGAPLNKSSIGTLPVSNSERKAGSCEPKHNIASRNFPLRPARRFVHGLSKRRTFNSK